MNAISKIRPLVDVAPAPKPFEPIFIEVVQPADIPESLSAIMKRHRFSTRLAGELAGVSAPTISRAQRGRPIDAVTLVALSRFIRAWFWEEPAHG